MKRAVLAALRAQLELLSFDGKRTSDSLSPDALSSYLIYAGM